MKAILAFVGLFILGVSGIVFEAYSETVNPASNVTADSANTPGTIVLRASGTGIADITLAAGNVDTAKIATDAVTRAKILNGSVDTIKILTQTNDSGKILVSCGGAALWRVGGTCP